MFDSKKFLNKKNSILNKKDFEIHVVYGVLGNSCETPKATYNGIIFEKLGCWHDTKVRALFSLGYDYFNDPLYSCYISSSNSKFEIFSLQYNHECWAGNGSSYQIFGRSNNCNPNGRGGSWANEVYKVNKNSLEFNKTVNFRNAIWENCTSYQPTDIVTDSCTNPCFWSNSVCINKDECYICTCDTSWNLGENVFRCNKIFNCKPQLNVISDAAMTESFLYITLQINYWSLDEQAVNVTWKYFFPFFIMPQPVPSLLDVVYNGSNIFQYKVLSLQEMGINQSIISSINYDRCFFCETYIDIPIKLYFENTIGLSWKSNQSIRTNLKENCVVQSHSSDIDCIKLCVWTSNVCVDGEECYTCTCDLGWRLNNNNYSCVDVDECTDSNQPCNWTNSVCTNTKGSYICTCEAGWILDNYNNSCIDVNECAGLNQLCNWTNSVCTNTNGSYICTCESGWLLGKNNNSCIDVNECAGSNQPCNWTNSVCTNTNGSYICTCKSGWLLGKNNNSCVDFNECTGSNQPCNWTNSVCTNIDGTYICTCESGWLLSENNSSCVDVDECTGSNKPCNWTNSVCTNTKGSYICTCASGWLLGKNKNSCMDFDECTGSNQSCNWTNSVCTNSNGSFFCSCKSGWVMDKSNGSCVEIDDCTGSNKPCKWTSSFCTNTNGSYTCTCRYGWMLDKYHDRCIDECTSLNKPCNLNNHVCTYINGKYECIEGEWNIWGECSKTCGLGYKYSYLRTMLSSYKDVKRVETCTNFMCPVDSKWSTWVNYESFTNSCVSFTRRERICSNSTPKDAENGYNCFGLNLDFQFYETDTICPVHGGWTQWSLWSLCNQACLGGIQTRYRSCTNPLPKYGGLQCNGNETEYNDCYLDKCKEVAVNLNIIFKDVEYQGVYFNPTNKPYKLLENRIQNAVQDLYNKFNMSVQFNLVLNSLKKSIVDQLNL